MIKIDFSRDELLTEAGVTVLKDRYMMEGETSPQEVFARVAKSYSDSPEMAQRVYDYLSKLWLSAASPILSNAGNAKGAPVSCFLNYADDSRTGLCAINTETALLNSYGGGIGSYYGHVRSVGAKTSSGNVSYGVIPHLKVIDSLILAYHQGSTRRGSAAIYLDVMHPEIIEFVNMRKPGGGDFHRKALNIHHAVIIPNEFMAVLKRREKDPNANTNWDLIDPNSGDVVETVCAVDLWKRLMETRHQTGEPYLMFTDTVNDARHPAHIAAGLKILQSNLCAEICQPTNKDRTAVCCLSSVNVHKFDEWYPVIEQFIYDVVRFLDNVIESFINSNIPGTEKAVYAAMRERSIGIGTLGFVSYLQKRGWAMGLMAARRFNVRLYSELKRCAVLATRKLAVERGECPDGIGYGVRNIYLLAIAPNATSAIVCETVSPGIEAYPGNIFNQKTKSGSLYIKNVELVRVLEQKGMNTDEVWNRIALDEGSVKNLEFLTDYEKEVFRTAMELDQIDVVRYAGARQKFICQSQSLNLYFPATVSAEYIHRVHMRAFDEGVKTLYYLRSDKRRAADKVNSKIEMVALESECIACEG